MKGNLKFFGVVMAAMMAGADWFLGGKVPSGNLSKTPQIPHHNRPRHYHPHIPNGKWVMKYHR